MTFSIHSIKEYIHRGSDCANTLKKNLVPKINVFWDQKFLTLPLEKPYKPLWSQKLPKKSFESILIIDAEKFWI